MELNMASVYPRGTPLPAMVGCLREQVALGDDDNQCPLSIVSMNLLAPLYVRPLDKRTGSVQTFAAFEWVQDDILLEWESRCVRLLACLTSCQADVICVQELQLERKNDSHGLPAWLEPLTEKHGYTVILPPQEELGKIAARNLRVLGADAAVACAVFVNPSQWKVFHASSSHNNSTCVSVRIDHVTQDRMDPIVVSSIHLDATDEAKRIRQLKKCLDRSAALIKGTDKDEIRPLTVILAGDMNAELGTGSCMSAILQDYDQTKVVSENEVEKACREALRLTGDTTLNQEQLDWFKRLQNDALTMVQDHCISVDRVDTGPTRCAYDHSDAEAPKQLATWKLDHVLYTSERLVPIARWTTLEDDPESCTTGLPNHKCPSDHLPIACVFAVQLNAPCTEACRQKISQRVEELVLRQQKVRRNLQAEMELKHQDILRRLAANGTHLSEDSRLGQKKKRKGPPPKEMIEFTRESRAIMNQIKKEQEGARERLIRELSNSERRIVQHYVGKPWRQWVTEG